MAEAAVEALDSDAGTEVTLLVSKPPAPAVAERLLGKPRNKPIVAALIGLERPVAAASGVTVCTTLEQGVTEALAQLGLPDGDRSAPSTPKSLDSAPSSTHPEAEWWGCSAGAPWPTKR